MKTFKRSAAEQNISFYHNFDILIICLALLKCDFNREITENPSPRWDMNPRPSVIYNVVGCSTTELLRTLWWARVKLWVLTGTASRGYAHLLAHMNSLTASRRHIKASRITSLTVLRRRIKAYRDASNQPPKWVYREITTTWYSVNSRRKVDSEKNPSPRWDV